jgi:hypothetical protein
MAKIQCSDGLMGKRKIAILNIDYILNKFFSGQVRCQSACYNKSKWVYILNSVEKWLCESQKKKTVVDVAISIDSAILEF